MDQRNKYDNLILLCREHHKLVDDQANRFTPEDLRRMKAEHERRVAEGWGETDKATQRAREVVASYIETWAELSDLDHWNSWTCKLQSPGAYFMAAEHYQKLRQLGPWLLSRIWPGEFPAVQRALLNFRHVLQDLLTVFDRHRDPKGDVIWTEKFYQIPEWNPELHERLAAQYDEHVRLLEELMLELTRAANLVCQRVRESLDPLFRIEEGALLVDMGPYEDLQFITVRAEYSADQLRDKPEPYEGLAEFQKRPARRRQAPADERPGSG